MIIILITHIIINGMFCIIICSLLKYNTKYKDGIIYEIQKCLPEDLIKKDKNNADAIANIMD